MMRALPQEDLFSIVSKVDWSPLEGACILLTGGTGFIGQWLAQSFALANKLENLNATMLIMSRQVGPHFDDAVGYIQQDVCVAERSLRCGMITHCIHAACPSCANPPVDDLTMWRTVVNGTDNVLRWCHENEAKRILYISSGAAEHRPDTAYGAAKKAAETLCGIYAKQYYGMEIPIARPYALIGPGLPLDAHFAIGNFIRDALAGGPVKVVIGHTILRSYLYASDMAIQLWRLLLKGPSCIPVDIGSRNVRSIRSVAHLVAGTLNVPVEATDVAGESPDSYVPKLGLSEDTKRVGLKEAILKTARWHGWGE